MRLFWGSINKMQMRCSTRHHPVSVCLATLACGWVLAMAVAAPTALAEESYTVNFKDTDIQELIRFVADVSDRTFLIDPRVKGKVHVISAAPVSTEQLYDLFLAILDVHGFTAVETTDGLITVLPEQQARTLPGPVGDRGATGRENREVVTRVLPLRNIAASKLIAVLRPLAPQHAHMAAYPPTNSIILSDSAANIAKLLRVIKQLDKETEGQVDSIELRYADVSEVERILRDLMKKELSDQGTQLVLVADKRSNRLLVKGGAVLRQKAQELIAELDSPVGRLENARVIYLKHADAKQLADVLNQVVANIQSGNKDSGGNIGEGAGLQADEATNSLIITASSEMIKTLEAIIARLDIRRQQVLVELIIAEVEGTDDNALGLELLFADSNLGLLSSGTGDGLLRTLATALSANTGNTGRTLLSNLAGSLTTVDGQTLTIGDLESSDRIFAGILTALKRNTEANILATPNLLTLDNTEASIVVGQNVPFITGSYVSGTNASVNPFQTISRQDVGITLKVKPNISDGDIVLLNIEQEVSGVTGNVQQAVAADIITNKRVIKTSVLAGDGQIVVLGGLIRDEVQETKYALPILGQLPILGRLFRHSTVQVRKTNLLVFIRPTIIRNNEDMTRETAAKYKWTRQRQLHKRKQGVDFLEPEQLPLLPAWDEQLRRHLNSQFESDRVGEATGSR